MKRMVDHVVKRDMPVSHLQVQGTVLGTTIYLLMNLPFCLSAAPGLYERYNGSCHARATYQTHLATRIVLHL